MMGSGEGDCEFATVPKRSVMKAQASRWVFKEWLLGWAR
jgi:hypothetical protein